MSEEPQDPAAMPGAPSEEELRAALEEQMKHIRVDDVILQTVATLVNLAGRRMGMVNDDPAERDVAQAQQAIEAVRALLPLSPEEQLEPIKAALAQLQMAFAREAQAGGAPPPGDPAAPGDQPPPPAAKQADPPAEPDPGPSRIWTPPGA